MNQAASFKRAALLLVTLLTLVFATSQAAFAQDQEEAMAGDLLDSIHQFRLQNFIALNAYYNYSATPDNQLVADINRAMSRSSTLMTDIENQAGDTLSGSSLEDLQAAFADFENQMNTNVSDIQESGFPDLRLLSEMAEQAQTLSILSENIYEEVAGQDVTPTVSDIELAREASITMALMVTRYSARSSSTMAQVFQGAVDDTSIDELARQFDDIMNQLRSRLSQDQMARLLSDANSKWEFIRNSYINYDERNVSFVINRYSLNIVDSLEGVIDQLKTS